MGRGEGRRDPQGRRGADHRSGARHGVAGASQHRGGDRRERRRKAHARGCAVAGRPLRVDAQVHAQGGHLAVRRSGEADSETHPLGLHRKFAGRAARSQRALRQDQHRRLQRPATSHYRLAGRQAQRRRLDAARSVEALSQKGADLLAAPRRRRDFDGRHLHPSGRPRARRARGLRDVGRFRRQRRRRPATARYGARTGFRGSFR